MLGVVHSPLFLSAAVVGWITTKYTKLNMKRATNDSDDKLSHLPHFTHSQKSFKITSERDKNNVKERWKV